VAKLTGKAEVVAGVAVANVEASNVESRLRIAGAMSSAAPQGRRVQLPKA
jgi:hypothetical protein